MRRAANRADWSLGSHVHTSVSDGVALSSPTRALAMVVNHIVGAGPGSSGNSGLGRPVPSHSTCVQNPIPVPWGFAKPTTVHSGQLGTGGLGRPFMRARANAAVSR